MAKDLAASGGARGKERIPPSPPGPARPTAKIEHEGGGLGTRKITDVTARVFLNCMILE